MVVLRFVGFALSKQLLIDYMVYFRPLEASFLGLVEDQFPRRSIISLVLKRLNRLLRPFHRVKERHEAADEDTDGDEDEITYVVFETNDSGISPPVDATVEDEWEGWDQEVVRWAARHVRDYCWRWGVEIDYKDLKKFRVDSSSKKHHYRFFNFVFVCLFYNSWMMVYLLVKLAIEEDPDSSPIITAATFVSIAESHFGLGTPPPEWSAA